MNAQVMYLAFKSILIRNVVIDCPDHLIFLFVTLLVQQLLLHAMTC